LIHDGVTATTASETTKVVNFGQLFFIITGFHGLHVLFGVFLLIWLMISAMNGRFEQVGHYEMVEKIGLYWHFVDLVWVYVFLCFYLL
jgi:cytochrome c oxidase subunit 3